MNRRGFLSGLLSAAAATAIPIPEIWLPEKKIFLPPIGGWVGRGNHLLTPSMISREMLAILETNLRMMMAVDKEYAAAWLAPVGNTIQIRQPLIAA